MDALSKGTASARVDSEPPELQSQLLQNDSTLIVAQSVSLTLDNDFLAIVGMCYCLWPVRKQKESKERKAVLTWTCWGRCAHFAQVESRPLLLRNPGQSQ